MFARALYQIQAYNQPPELQIVKWKVELSLACPFTYKLIYDNIMFQ